MMPGIEGHSSEPKRWYQTKERAISLVSLTAFWLTLRRERRSGRDSMIGAGISTQVNESDKEEFRETQPSPLVRSREGWPVWTAGYLTALAKHGQKVKAAKDCDVDPSTVIYMRRRCPEFIIAEKAAMEDAKEVFESEAIRRAVDGVERVHYGRDGRVTSREIIFSDAILLRLLEKTETGSWRQRQQLEVGGPHSFGTLGELDKSMSQDFAELSAKPTGELGNGAEGPVIETQKAKLIETACSTEKEMGPILDVTPLSPEGSPVTP